ncbi:unnamed protein product [Sphagnum tenellum]
MASDIEIIDKLKGQFTKGSDNSILNFYLNKATFTEQFGTSSTTVGGTGVGGPTSGLTAYDLKAPALNMYPVLTPLRNETPRDQGGMGVQANWRVITSPNNTSNRIGIPVGGRAPTLQPATRDVIAAFRGIGTESSVDFEAQYAGQGFEDVRAKSVLMGLQSLMIGEEQMMLGGNNSYSLGAASGITLSTSTTGGSLAAGTWYVVCLPLSYQGYINGSVATGIQQTVNYIPAGPVGSNTLVGGGASLVGTSGQSYTSIATTGSTSTISATVNTIRGAAAYAWFWGTSQGSEVLGAITTINSVTITSAPVTTSSTVKFNGITSGVYNSSNLTVGGSLAAGNWYTSATDYSTCVNEFDGLLTMCANSTGYPGAYYAQQATGTAGVGTPLTADGATGIYEIDLALKTMWDTYRLTPDTMWVNSQEAWNISKKILAGGTSSAQRIIFTKDQEGLTGGVMATTYTNRFTSSNGQGDGSGDIRIRIHPYMPAGTLLMTSKMVPYNQSGISNAFRILCRQDYYQIEWPRFTRQWQYGVYADEVLQHYWPASMAVISNIGNG